MNIYLIVAASFCTGIIAISLSLIFVLGYEVRSTRYHGLFWCSILFYLICQLLHYMDIVPLYFVYSNFLIPIFFIFFISVYHFGHFKKIFLIFFLIPVTTFFLIIFTQKEIIFPVYHLTLWSIIIAVTLLFVKRNDAKQKDIYFNFKFITIVLIAIAPFILISLILALVFKEDINAFILFPSLAITIICEMFFIYKNNLLFLNFNFYENLEMIKRQSSYEKKSIIEKLSSSLIHEIKNPLAGIQSLAQQIVSKKEKITIDKAAFYSTLIIDETRRIIEMTNSYLQTFKKNAAEDIKEINLKDEIEPVINLIENTVKKERLNIESYFEGSAVVKFNSSNFRQIMLNLIYNSIEAKALNISITARDSGEFVEIRIRDDGDGINEAVKGKIFEMFFSTKNEGTGIGLSICREILNHSQGNIELVNNQKGYTEFRILIKKNPDLKLNARGNK